MLVKCIIIGWIKITLSNSETHLQTCMFSGKESQKPPKLTLFEHVCAETGHSIILELILVAQGIKYPSYLRTHP